MEGNYTLRKEGKLQYQRVKSQHMFNENESEDLESKRLSQRKKQLKNENVRIVTKV